MENALLAVGCVVALVFIFCRVDVKCTRTPGKLLSFKFKFEKD